jgi:hypothetical protein
MLAGYVAALIMGLTLGMIGAGGSILTVPILVYIFGVDPILATAYSLFVVGATALVGALGFARAGTIDYRAAALFGLPSVLMNNQQKRIFYISHGSLDLRIRTQQGNTPQEKETPICLVCWV